MAASRGLLAFLTLLSLPSLDPGLWQTGGAQAISSAGGRLMPEERGSAEPDRPPRVSRPSLPTSAALEWLHLRAASRSLLSSDLEDRRSGVSAAPLSNPPPQGPAPRPPPAQEATQAAPQNATGAVAEPGSAAAANQSLAGNSTSSPQSSPANSTAGVSVRQAALFPSTSGLFRAGSLCYSCSNIPSDARPGSGSCTEACAGMCCQMTWALVTPQGGYTTGTCYSGPCNSAPLLPRALPTVPVACLLWLLAAAFL